MAIHIQRSPAEPRACSATIRSVGPTLHNLETTHFAEAPCTGGDPHSVQTPDHVSAGRQILSTDSSVSTRPLGRRKYGRTTPRQADSRQNETGTAPSRKTEEVNDPAADQTDKTNPDRLQALPPPDPLPLSRPPDRRRAGYPTPGAAGGSGAAGPLLKGGVPEGGRLAPLEPARTSPGEGTPQRVSEWTTTI